MQYDVLGVGESLLIALCGFLTVFCMLLVLIAVIKVISAVVVKIEGSDKSPAPAPATAPTAPAEVKEEKPSKPWDGKLQLIDCDEETAACIMAIISDETDIPLDELQFRRIAAI